MKSNSYLLRKLMFLALSSILAQMQEHPRFTIERNGYGVSDRLIEIDEVDKDEKSFKNDGTCFGTKRNIASRIGETKIRCFSDSAVYYLDDACLGGIGLVTPQDAVYPLCSIKNITDILLWGPDGWRKFEFQEDDFLSTELSYNGQNLVFKDRQKWNGIFMRLIVDCQEGGNKCVTLKFIGKKKYPLPQNLADILVTPQTTTTFTTSATGTTTKFSTTGSTTTSVDTNTPTTLPSDKPVYTTHALLQTSGVVVTQYAVTVAEQKKMPEESSNYGLVIGVVLTIFILMLMVAAGLLYYRRQTKKPRRSKGEDVNGNQENVYDLKSENETQAFSREDCYATPQNEGPEYREVEAEYDQPDVSLAETYQEKPYDVPERNEELTKYNY